MAVTKDKILNVGPHLRPDKHGFTVNDYSLLVEGIIADHVLGLVGDERNKAYLSLTNRPFFRSIQRSTVNRVLARVVPPVDDPDLLPPMDPTYLTSSEVPRALAKMVRVSNPVIQREIRLLTR